MVDRWARKARTGKRNPMTTQSQPDDTQPQPDETQAQAGVSRESRSAGAMIRWPRDLTDLWGGWQPFGAMNWPFETSRSKSSLMASSWWSRQRYPGSIPKMTSMCQSTTAS